MNPRVRLTNQEIQSICQVIRKADSHSKIFLFGSRTDLLAKGGDIDLLVESAIIKLSDRVKILVGIKNLLGDQKIDLTVYSPLEPVSAFVENSKKSAVPLCGE